MSAETFRVTVGEKRRVEKVCWLLAPPAWKWHVEFHSYPVQFGQNQAHGSSLTAKESGKCWEAQACQESAMVWGVIWEVHCGCRLKGCKLGNSAEGSCNCLGTRLSLLPNLCRLQPAEPSAGKKDEWRQPRGRQTAWGWWVVSDGPVDGCKGQAQIGLQGSHWAWLGRGCYLRL